MSSSTTDPVPRWARLCLVAGWAVLMFPLLGRIPRPYVDDSWSQAMAAYTLAFEGVPRNPGHVAVGGWDAPPAAQPAGGSGTDRYLLEPRLFPSVVGAAVYRLAGFGLVAGRVTAVGFSGLFLWSVYGVMRRLFDAQTAWAVTLMTLIEPWAFITGRTFRAEIFVAALVWTAFRVMGDGPVPSAVEPSARRPTHRIAALSGGALIGLALWTHPNTWAFTVAGLLSIAVMTGLQGLRRVRVGWALVGVIAGLAPYLAYVVYAQAVSDVRLFVQLGSRMGAFARPAGEMLATEAQRWAHYLQWPLRLPLALLYLAALCTALLRKRGWTADWRSASWRPRR